MSADESSDSCTPAALTARVGLSLTFLGMTRPIVSRDYGFPILALIALAAGCASSPPVSRPAAVPGPPSRGTTVATPAPAVNVVAVADEVADRTNATRRSAGLPALLRSVNLMQAAQLQADQMVKAGRMGHELADQPFPTLKARLAAVQYAPRAAGENIAEGQRSAGQVLTMWMDSSAHRANILSRDYTEIGTGVAAARNGRLYFVQVFARPARTSGAVRTAPTG